MQHACLLSKNNFVQKTSKSDVMTSYVWHCFCTVCTKKIQVFITFQHYHVTQRLSCTTVLPLCWKQDQKYKTTRLRPRSNLENQDQDQGRSETSLVLIRPWCQTPRLTKWSINDRHRTFWKISNGISLQPVTRHPIQFMYTAWIQHGHCTLPSDSTHHC